MRVMEPKVQITPSPGAPLFATICLTVLLRLRYWWVGELDLARSIGLILIVVCVFFFSYSCSNLSWQLTSKWHLYFNHLPKNYTHQGQFCWVIKFGNPYRVGFQRSPLLRTSLMAGLNADDRKALLQALRLQAHQEFAGMGCGNNSGIQLPVQQPFCFSS